MPAELANGKHTATMGSMTLNTQNQSPPTVKQLAKSIVFDRGWYRIGTDFYPTYQAAMSVVKRQAAYYATPVPHNPDPHPTCPMC